MGLLDYVLVAGLGTAFEVMALKTNILERLGMYGVIAVFIVLFLCAYQLGCLRGKD